MALDKKQNVKSIKIYNFLFIFQLGFRQKLSTTDALHLLLNTFMKNLKQKRQKS